MSDVFWNGLFIFLGVCVTTYFSYKLNKVAKVANDTHTLVNSNMGVQLMLNAAVTKRLAELTKRPDDAEAAKLAEILYKEHVTAQALVDSGAPTRASKGKV